ncbi:cysteine hydrolase, partial [Escherichia coli]|nr:cysteine hydrolase [Escherichia coli]
MPNIAVLTNDLQYEFTYKITRSPEILAQKLVQFNQFLDGIRALDQSIIHLQLINDPNDPA